MKASSLFSLSLSLLSLYLSLFSLFIVVVVFAVVIESSCVVRLFMNVYSLAEACANMLKFVESNHQAKGLFRLPCQPILNIVSPCQSVREVKASSKTEYFALPYQMQQSFYKKRNTFVFFWRCYCTTGKSLLATDKNLNAFYSE